MTTELQRGHNAALDGTRHEASVTMGDTPLDITALLVTEGGGSPRVLGDDRMLFYNQPSGHGLHISGSRIDIDLGSVPDDVHSIVLAASVDTGNDEQVPLREPITFTLDGASPVTTTVSPEQGVTVIDVAELYRRGPTWKVRSVGQGWTSGLAGLAHDFGVQTDEAEPAPSVAPPTAHPVADGSIPHDLPSAPAPAPPAPATGDSAAQGATSPTSDGDAPAFAPPPPPAAEPEASDEAPRRYSMEKVVHVLQKDQVAKLDLRGDDGTIDNDLAMLVELEWDGRGATYDADGNVVRFGTGDMDVYFQMLSEGSSDWTILSGEKDPDGTPRLLGRLDRPPYAQHSGDVKEPGYGGRPACESVRLDPRANGSVAVNIYQAPDNGAGEIQSFGNTRVRIRVGKLLEDGTLDPATCTEYRFHPSSGYTDYWCTAIAAHIQDGQIEIVPLNRFSKSGSERMPGLNTKGQWTRKPPGGPTGQSKTWNDYGLTHYTGTLPEPFHRNASLPAIEGEQPARVARARRATVTPPAAPGTGTTGITGGTGATPSTDPTSIGHRLLGRFRRGAGRTSNDGNNSFGL